MLFFYYCLLVHITILTFATPHIFCMAPAAQKSSHYKNFINKKIADKNGYAALHLAASAGYEAVVAALLAGEADLAIKDNDGETPLHRAAYNQRSTKSVEVLLTKSTHQNLNALSNAKNTPLFIAAINGNVDIVQALLNKGANPNHVGESGNTPLHAAIHGSSEPLIEAFLKGNKEEIEKKYTTIVNLLIKHNADLHAKDKHGRTPLALAEQQQFYAAAAILRTLQSESYLQKLVEWSNQYPPTRLSNGQVQPINTHKNFQAPEEIFFKLEEEPISLLIQLKEKISTQTNKLSGARGYLTSKIDRLIKSK